MKKKNMQKKAQELKKKFQDIAKLKEKKREMPENSKKSQKL